MFLKIIHRSAYNRDKLQELPDPEIISVYKKQKDPELLGILFDRYIHLVFGVCMKYLKNKEEAKDAGMEIFESLFELLLEHKVEKFAPWLHTVSRNFCLMKLRKRHPEHFTEESLLTGKESAKFVEYTSDLHLIDEKEYKLAELEKAMELINNNQQQCIRLFFLENKNYNEVAALTGFNMKQVKSHLQNGKRNLKNILMSNDQKA